MLEEKPRPFRTSNLPPWLDLFPAFLVAIGMFCRTWHKWPDVLVDFGRELYIPWQLSLGKALYLDVAYFNGPLSPCFNSLWFRLLGPRLIVLAFVNLALLFLVIFLIHGLARKMSGRQGAIAASLVFVSVFAFGDYSDIGNYNYICPYSHEMVHGTLLSFAALRCMTAYCDCMHRKALVAAGLLTGLAFLTKVEIFLALFCAVGAALIAAHLLRRSRTSTSLKAALVLSASATIPPVIGMLWLVPALGPGGALKGVTGSFYYLITNSEISKLPFYVKRMGADDIGGNLMRMFKAAAVTAGLVAGAGTLGILFRYTKRRHAAIPAAVFIVFGLVFRFAFRFEWLTSIARPFPLFMLIIAATLVLTIVKHSRRPKERGNGRGGCALSRREIENKIEGSRSDLRAVDKLGFVVFSFLLLGKMILSSRIDGYGFVLAMPAAMTLTLLIDDWLPRWVTEKGGVGAVTRAAGVAVLAVVVGGFILVGNSHIAKKTAQVTNGSDTVLTYQSGAVINEGLSTLRTLIRPGETIAVFPEGVMLNYLMRVENPTPYVSYLPPEVSMFGEKAMLAAFKVHPPDYIVAVPRSFREYGVRGFGQGYAEELASWIVGNYQEIKTIMPEATRQAPLGKLFILRRKDRLH